jgi:hypothetical protein
LLFSIIINCENSKKPLWIFGKASSPAEGWMMNDEDEKPDVQFTLRGVTADYPGHEVALALVDNYRGISRCVGSGVAVAPGLAMTASHVIDGCVRYRQQVDGYRHSDQILSLTAVQSYDNKVFVWSVDFIYGSVLSDIAFLRFARPAGGAMVLAKRSQPLPDSISTLRLPVMEFVSSVFPIRKCGMVF